MNEDNLYTDYGNYSINEHSIMLFLDESSKNVEDKNADTRDVIASCVFKYKGSTYRARAIVVEGFVETITNLDDPDEVLSYTHKEISSITDEVVISALKEKIKLMIDSIEIKNSKVEFEKELDRFFNSYVYNKDN